MTLPHLIVSLRKFRNTYVVLSNACADFFYFLARIVSLPPRLCILSYNFVNTWATRCSSFVTVARPSTSPSLRTTHRSFQYASPRLWNRFSASLRQPRTHLSTSVSQSPLSGTSSIGSIDSPLSLSVACSLFHFRLKTFFHKSFPP